MLHFDKRGYLAPYKVIPSTVEEMKEYFVDNIKSDTRKEIFERYIRYSNDLKHVLGGIPLKQWVNGSFVTMKKDPKDIDLVTLVDIALIKKFGVKLDVFRTGMSWKHYGVDAYILETHPGNSDKYKLMEYDIRDWLILFINNKKEKGELRTEKGFLEIIY